MNSSSLYPKEVTLTNCDKEPIHILGKIQSCGYLIAADSKTHTITYCSENTSELLDKEASAILGKKLSVFFDDETLNPLNKLQPEEKAAPQKLSFKGVDYLVIPHKYQGNLILEFEPFQADENPYAHQLYLSKIVSELNAVDQEQDMCNLTASLIKESFGYNRVMIYRFDANWDGVVVSEQKEESMESWLGLRYPASDIPQQARKLFLKQGVRIIADVKSDPIPIQALSGDEQENPVDLTQSELRASSPIHIEYLENMGVGASLTAAIISKGTLWGLIACHHNSPKFISYYKRQSCKFLTQVFSSRLILSGANQMLQKINHTAEIRNKLLERISKDWKVVEGLTAHDINMLHVTEAHGAAVLLDGQIKCVGKTPDDEKIIEVIETLAQIEHLDSYYFTDSFSKEFEDFSDLKKVASGVLCIFLSSSKKDALLWFKPEKQETVNWAGNPDKSVVSEDKVRISPRKSFEKWSVLQRGHSEPWQEYELAAAEALKQDISEIILEKYEEVKALNIKLERAYQDLETFSYSVAHDLRAPLRGIDGFAQILKEDYYEHLDSFGKSSIETILESATKMNQLIDDILEYSRVSQVNLSRGRFSLQKVVANLIDFLNVNVEFPKTKILVDSEIPDVFADQRMLTQVMQNLLTNALKYSAHKPQPLIEIGFEVDAGKTYYFVKDNGMGFDQEKHSQRIFQLFNRLVGKEYPGSGVGLTIVERIIKKHNGRLKVVSEPGEGSTFFFTLD